MTETEMQQAEETTAETTVETPETEQIDPLDDAIAKALDSFEESSGDDEDLPEGDEESTDTQPADETASEDVPEHWPEERKQAFKSLKDEEARKLVREMSKDMEAAHTKRSQEVAESRRQIDSALEPLKPVLEQYGLDSVSGVRELVKFHQDLQPYVRGLQTNPKETIQLLAKQYKVELNGMEADEYIDPDTKALRDELNQLKGVIQQQQFSQQQAEQQTYQQQITQFATATDESGNPKHPHFEAVRGDMVNLFKGGLAANLEEAYEKAVYLKPELRQQLTQQQIDAKLAEDRKRQQEELERAKKGGRRLSGNGPAKKAPTKAASIDEAFNAAWEQFSAA